MKLIARAPYSGCWHVLKLSLTLAFLSFYLSGCISSNGVVSSASNHSANKMVVIGVPMLIGGFGSAVPVSKEYMLTAKHVAQVSWDLDVIHHPVCDLSLVKRPSDNVPKWGLIYPDQDVSHHGHSVLGNKIKGKGKYLQDVIDTNTNCLYSLSDAPVMSGMSGGPVFNQQGEIAGITVAIVHNPEDLRNLRPAERYSQFVPSTLIFDWLNALGVSTQSASKDLANIQVSEYVANLNRPDQQNTILANHAANSNEQGGSTFTPVSNQNNLAPAASSPLVNYRTPLRSTFLSPQSANKSANEESDTAAVTTQSSDKQNQRNLLNKSGYNSLY
ncbi:serine protease [Photobacterium makurazakiensis]|uniref:S1 family peptidase n=1 Tax=Photobacterium makurazakiensis TaxID=2910234 RepID=UPI003D0F51DA